jgi:hypothetical protein
MRSFALGVVLLTIPLFGCATLTRPSNDGPKTLFQWNSPEFQAPAKEQNPKEPEKPNPIVTDRPDFTEASSTVGLAHIQLETGYTYSRSRDDGVLRIGHTYPEALVRVGLVRDWMELRFGQNFGSDHQSATGRGAFVHGADDVYLGVKLGLTEQDGAKPETAIVLQTTVPTGTEERSARRALPGMNFLYGWDVIEDKITLGGSFQTLSSMTATTGAT